MTTTFGNPLDLFAEMATPGVIDEPWPLFSWLRENEPLHQLAPHLWVLSRHEDVTTGLRNDLFPGPRGDQLSTLFPQALRHRSMQLLADSIGVANPPRHTHLRKIMSFYLSPRRVNELRGLVATICEETVNGIEDLLHGGEVVDMHSVATTIAINVLSGIMGVRDEDRDELAALVNDVLAIVNPGQAILISTAPICRVYRSRSTSTSWRTSGPATLGTI